MAIIGRPKKDTLGMVTKEDSFIDSAPDAAKTETAMNKALPKRVRKGNKGLYDCHLQ